MLTLAYRIVNSVHTKEYAVDSPKLLAPNYRRTLFKVSGYFMCSFEIGWRFTDGMSLAVAKFNDGTQAMRGAHVLAQIKGMVRVTDELLKLASSSHWGRCPPFTGKQYPSGESEGRAISGTMLSPSVRSPKRIDVYPSKKGFKLSCLSRAKNRFSFCRSSGVARSLTQSCGRIGAGASA